MPRYQAVRPERDQALHRELREGPGREGKRIKDLVTLNAKFDADKASADAELRQAMVAKLKSLGEICDTTSKAWPKLIAFAKEADLPVGKLKGHETFSHDYLNFERIVNFFLKNEKTARKALAENDVGQDKLIKECQLLQPTGEALRVKLAPIAREERSCVPFFSTTSSRSRRQCNDSGPNKSLQPTAGP